MSRKKALLDGSVLQNTLVELCGQLTFLEAFDRTGRVLNVTVTRARAAHTPRREGPVRARVCTRCPNLLARRMCRRR